MDTRTVYVGSLWHRYCDPFATVTGFNATNVQETLDKLAADEYDRVCLNLEEDEQEHIDIYSSGVFAEAIILDDDASPYFLPLFGTPEYALARDELESDGITVI